MKYYREHMLLPAPEASAAAKPSAE